MVKPKMLQDNFGDEWLSCPKCKEPIHFPVVRNIEKHKPKKCSKCGAEFNWSKTEKG